MVKIIITIIINHHPSSSSSLPLSPLWYHHPDDLPLPVRTSGPLNLLPTTTPGLVVGLRWSSMIKDLVGGVYGWSTKRSGRREVNEAGVDFPFTNIVGAVSNIEERSSALLMGDNKKVW